MQYTDLLNYKIYFVQGYFKYENPYKNIIPWGEVDFQSGIERWKLTRLALFDDIHTTDTDLNLIPEIDLYIDVSSIKFSENPIIFSALAIFRYNPYFSEKAFNINENSKIGLLATGIAKHVIGKFEIIREADPTELVTWLHEII